MTHMAVDQQALVRFASQPAFSWMASLRAIRIWQQVKVGKRCCGQAPAAVPLSVVQEVVRSESFARDLIQLKQRMKVDRLIVNVSGYRQAV